MRSIFREQDNFTPLVISRMSINVCFISLDPVFNELSATTRNDIREGIVYNEFFVDTPFQDHLRREGAIDPFAGGLLMQEPIQVNGPDGGGVESGQTVTVTRKQLISALGFLPKKYATWFSADDYEMSNGQSSGVLNTGVNAAVDLYMAYLESLTEQLNTFIEMDSYRHGQASSATVSDNRTLLINGMSELCNNGIDPSWDGNIFTSYGQAVRGGFVSNTLNSIPRWAGNPDGTTGQISYEFLLQTYSQAIHRPTIGIVSQIGYTYIASLFQRQQRFDVLGVKKDGIQWAGISFEDAVIYQDWLTPSAADPSFLPTNLVGGGGQTNQTGTIAIGAAPSAASGLPANTTVTVGETGWWLNGKTWHARPTTDQAWFFGIRRTSAYDNISLDAIFMRLAYNLYSDSPRDNVQYYGYAS